MFCPILSTLPISLTTVNIPACNPAAFLFRGVLFRGVIVRTGVAGVSDVSALAADDDDCSAALLPAAAVAEARTPGL